MFVGNLGNEVDDTVLARVFNKYPSFHKAKVMDDPAAAGPNPTVTGSDPTATGTDPTQLGWDANLFAYPFLPVTPSITRHPKSWLNA